jgi:predicted XRE-type DNA-binding protein
MSYTRSKRKPKRRRGAISRSAGSVTARSKTGAARVRKLEEIKFIQGSDNVFEDLGFDREEAANLKIRADLMIDLREYIRARGWTQAEAADFFGETQPRISNLMKGEISRFSIDKLINMLARAGLRVRLETKPRAA